VFCFTGQLTPPWNCFCFLFSFSTNLIDTYVTVPMDVHITLRICLNSFSTFIFISLIPVMCVSTCIRISPPLPLSYTCIIIYYHIHKYVLCPVVYLSPSFCFLSSFSVNLIDTYVTVPIDVNITPLICLDSFPSTSSFFTSLPPHVHLWLHPNTRTYFNTSSGPFIRTSCSLMCSCTCKFLRICI